MVTNIIREYYFSVDNLCKDMFLRRQMDSQGFVFLEVLAKFNRIKQLTTNLNMIRYACVNSPSIEYYTPPDGIDRIRKRDGWQHWVLKMEERDPPAQNDGPPMPRPEPPQIYNVPHTSDDRQGMSPRFGAISPMENIQYQSLDDATPASGRSDAAGVVNAAEASTTRTPLSAAVSEFSPSVRSINNRSFSSQDSHTQASSVFTDEQVDNLHIIVRKPMNSAVPTHPPFHSSSSRTFSNGSIDGRSINDELAKYADRQPAPTHNGDNSDT